MLPDDAEAADQLAQLAVEPVDQATTLASRPDPTRHPELWWLLDRGYHVLLATMGQPPAGGWPALPAATGPVGRHLYAWLCLAVLPHVRRFHTARGVPDDISWATLTDLGQELISSRLLTGTSGLDASWNLPRVLRGTYYKLGRLTFERGLPAPDPSNHPVLRPGQTGIGTHIPSGAGPLHPEACDDSFAQARAFFPHHLPEQPATFGCHSWLMDDQLAEYLAEDSNIIQFQRRFDRFTDREPADWAPLEHLFHRRYEGKHPPTDLLNELPQETTLQRAIVTHLLAGGHWYNRTGWLRF
ncbi:acyltransferase domain-containing protein [Actinopolymorpha sp. B9G3]|uniref:acyltransferase domain-containing protein n=1 Tax=Actinopolymorpha sp. B9G3 TaxID=3158970 RepID=UPI0032D947C0